MNRIKRAMTAMGLAGLLLCAGCTGGAGNANTGELSSGGVSAADVQGVQGMFVQSKLNPDTQEEISYDSLYRQEDGSLLLTGWGEDGQPCVFTGDGLGEWEETANPAAAAFASEQRQSGETPKFTLTMDGNWWFALSERYRGNGEQASEEDLALAPPHLVRVTAGQETARFDIPLEEAQSGEHYTLDVLVPGVGGQVYGLLTEVYKYEKAYWMAFDGSTGKVVAKVALNPGEHAVHDSVFKKNKLYVPNSASSQLDVFSMENGTKLESIAIPSLKFGWESVNFAIAENGDFCYANSAGIHRVAQGGTLVQDMVNGTQFVFAAPEYYGMQLVAMEDGSYLHLATDDGRASALYRFVFDENAHIDAANTLRVWALAENHVLRAAIAAFAKTNPEVYVTVEYGRSADATGATDEDIICILNTRLLTGDAPDVLILDGLSAEPYFKRGLLADLTGQVDISGCYENIMQAYTVDGKAFGYPALFQMPLFMANAGDENAAGVENLAALATLAEEEDALYYGSYLEMFEALYMAYGNEIFPDAAGVNEEALQNFLANTKRISDVLKLTDENNYMHGGVGNSGVYPRQGLASFMETNSLYAADILWEPIDVSVMYQMSGAKAFSPLPGGSFIPVCAGAVPESAQNKKAALAFIEEMIQNKEVQTLSMDQGFSVKIGQHLPKYEDWAELSPTPDGSSPAEYDWDSLVASFTRAANTEKVLQQKLYEQAQRLYAGQSTLQEAVDGVLQNTGLYFEERN